MDQLQGVYRVMHLTFSFLPETKSFGYSFRRPLPEGEVYKPRVHFARPETSDLLNRIMPCDYIQATWDLSEAGIEEAFKVLVEGLNSDTVPGFPEELGRWEYFCGTARDHAKAIFVPEGSNLDLSEVGILADLSPKGSKGLYEMAATIMKRLNRLFAPVEFSMFGDVVEYREYPHEGFVPGEIRFTVKGDDDNGRFDIRVLPADVYTDGMNLLGPRGAQLLAGLPDPKNGDGCRITAATPFGLAKGHAMVKDDLRYDAVLYGIKPELKFTGFYFGRLSELHVSDPNTDFQSLINFFCTGDGLSLLGKMYEKFFDRMVEASQDTERFRRMMRGVLDRNPETTWLRARATELCLDSCFPGLFRSDVKMLMPAINKTKEGVVAMESFATRRYIMPSPYIFDNEGNVHPDRDRLRGNCVFSAGVPAGPIVLYRQPNGNVDEHWNTFCSQTPHKNMGRGQIIYLGADMIPGALKAMGGGDFDDPVIVVYDQLMVNHFRNLPAYPKVEAAQAPKSETQPRNLKYVNRIAGRVDPTQWSLSHLIKQIEDLRSATGIGVVVNAIMYDTLMSIGKPSMLKDLTEQIASVSSRLDNDASKRRPEDLALLEQLTDAYRWLYDRPDFQLRSIASDLEARIDSIKMLGGTGMSTDKDMIDKMYEEALVFPWCWTIGGFLGNGRIPERALQKPICVAKTQLCHVLKNDAMEQIDALQEAFIELEWGLVKPLPQQLLSKYKNDKELNKFVAEMRVWWRESWEEARLVGNLEDPEAVRAVYQRLEEELEMHISDSAFANRTEEIAVVLAKRIYRQMHPTAPLGDNGKTYHVPDGLLWTRPLGFAFMEALEKAGLTGHAEKVTLEPGVRFDKGEAVPVYVEMGQVIDADNGKVLGEAQNVPESVEGPGKVHQYLLVDGYIQVKEVHPLLKSNTILK